MTIDNTNIPFADKVQLPTIRDQIAIASLPALIANTNLGSDYNVSQPYINFLAEIAYKVADAMLKARAE